MRITKASDPWFLRLHGGLASLRMKPFRYVGLQKAFPVQSEWKLWIGIIHIDYKSLGRADINASPFSSQTLRSTTFTGFRTSNLVLELYISIPSLKQSDHEIYLRLYTYNEVPKFHIVNAGYSEPASLLKWLEFKDVAGLSQEFCKRWQSRGLFGLPDCKIGCHLRNSENWKYKRFLPFLELLIA